MSKSTAPPTVILSCVCSHTYQDSYHGDGLRVFNHAPKKSTEPHRYRCTVCGQTRNYVNPATSEPPKKGKK